MRRPFMVLAALAVPGCGAILGADFGGLHGAPIDAGVDAGLADARLPEVPRDGESDATSDADAACVDPTELYVGSAGPCVFPSITVAIAYAHRLQAARETTRTIHVGPGVYSAARGETFPLDLRDGISLVGDSPSTTVIEGVGPYDHGAEGGAFGAAPLMLTLLAGHATLPTRVANLRLASQATAAQYVIGVFCDRGNAVGSGPPPGPSLVVDGLQIGSGYEVGVVVTSSEVPALGCNALITGSTFEAGSWVGVEVGGCAGPNKVAYSSAEIGQGDVAAHVSNTFDHVGKGDGSHEVLDLWSCVSSLSVRGNRFVEGEAAVMLGSDDLHVTVEGNDFEHVAAGGIVFQGPAIADSIANNRFVQLDVPAIWLQNAGAQILSARGNTFFSNQYAVRFEPVGTFGGTFDFGTAASHGNNVFRCNANWPTGTWPSTNVGYDVAQLAPAANAVSLVGNAWDHAPPHASAQLANGQDVVLPPSGPAPLVDDATIDTDPCPPGDTAGP
jgi:hypothetical protein